MTKEISCRHFTLHFHGEDQCATLDRLEETLRIERELWQRREERQRRTEGAQRPQVATGFSESFASTYAVIGGMIETVDFAPTPDPAAIAAHMVNLLNDETFCANIRELGCAGSFGTVIRDVATALATRGVQL